MIRRPPRSTRTDTLFPYTTLFRSIPIRRILDRNLALLSPEEGSSSLPRNNACRYQMSRAEAREMTTPVHLCQFRVLPLYPSSLERINPNTTVRAALSAPPYSRRVTAFLPAGLVFEEPGSFTAEGVESSFRYPLNTSNTSARNSNKLGKRT